MNRNTYIYIGIAFAIFLGAFFIVGPWLQHSVIEPNQPYIIIDPEIKAETGCQYDYLTYLPVEVTGRDPKDGIRFPITSVPADYKQFVHYPDSWNNPLNFYNPENKLGGIIQTVGMVLIVVLVAAFFIYLSLLWRKGKLKKLADKLQGKEEDNG